MGHGGEGLGVGGEWFGRGAGDFRAGMMISPLLGLGLGFEGEMRKMVEKGETMVEKF
ncbi:hypothetical protein Tco_0507093, partial [Tanacetum coccineum]